MNRGLCGWVARSRQVILNGNPSVETELLEAEPRMSHMRSALAVPLIGREGNLIGVVALYKIEKEWFSTRHLRTLQSAQSKLTHSIEQTHSAMDFAQVV